MAGEPTPETIESDLGRKIRTLRLSRNINRVALAASAGVSESALKRLELGKGSTLRTLIGVLRALEQMDWLGMLISDEAGNTISMSKRATPRRRASRRRADS